MAITALDTHFAAEVAAAEIDRTRRDPLARFTFKNLKQRRMVENFPRAEVYFHAANSAGKTTVGSALDVALTRGLSQLGGTKIPVIEMPAHGALIVGSYKQAVGSSIAMIRQMLGAWPHREAMVQSSMDYVGMFLIRPDGWRDGNPKTWSRLYVFPHDGELPEGLRLDFVHADEIPPPAVWRACRFRAKAGRAFYAYITGTPIYEREWRWLMQEGEFLHCLDQIKNGRLRLQSSIYDNQALTRTDIERAERAAASDPHGRARLHGEHTDISGSCPFSEPFLIRLRERCKAPRMEAVTIQTKRGDPGAGTPEITLPVAFWGPCDDRDCYYLTADLASGFRGEHHDPLCVHVWARSARRLIACYNGFVHPYGLGWLAAELARRYATPVGPCQVDPERNGGYIDQFLEGLYAGGHYDVAYQRDRGRITDRIGYDQSKATRDNVVAAWHRALMNDDIVMESEEVVSCLSHIIDNQGSIEARVGYHDEHMICGGRAIHILDGADRRGARRAGRQLSSDPEQAFAEALRDLFGRPIIRPSRGREPEPARWSIPCA